MVSELSEEIYPTVPKPVTVDARFAVVGPIFVTVTIPVPAPGETLIPAPAMSWVTPPPPPPPAPPETNAPFRSKVAPLTVKKFKSFVHVSKRFTEESVTNPVLMPFAEPNVLTYPEVPRPTTVETRFAFVTSPEPPPAVEI
jgi:hypothetical protein